MVKVCGGVNREDGVLAWFISPHGFGHAARASAIIAACSSARPGIRHHLFTTVAEAFFSDSLAHVVHEFHHCECDVGMVQSTPFVEDVEGTLQALDRLPLAGRPGFEKVVAEVAATGCRLIVSDIAPLGLSIAHRLAVPGVLVENFTWDWIYRAYGDPGLDEFGDRLTEIFCSASLRIQTVPTCRPIEGAHAVAPISRDRRHSRTAVRRELDIGDNRHLVLLSVSGVRSSDTAHRGLRPPEGTVFVVPGPANRVTAEGKIIRIPAFGGPYHPDLVGASDLVIAKLGYSTVAEVYHARTAFAYLRRSRFPESPILEAFADESNPSTALPDDWLSSPATTEVIQSLLDAPRPEGLRPNGAVDAASLILSMLE